MKNNFKITGNKSGFIGNYYDKYNSKNIIENLIIKNYFKTILQICIRYNITDFIDIGCGEGKWLYEFSNKGFKCIGTEYEDEVINIAKKNLEGLNFDIFKSNIYSENFAEIINNKINETEIKNIFFLEVLEHLNDPITIIKKLKKINFNYMIISVPNEPLWRFLNCCRLKYLKQLGNTPGHINHFSYFRFKKVLEKHFELVETNAPIPFLISLVKNV